MNNSFSVDLHIHREAIPGRILKASVESFVDMIEALADDIGISEEWVFSVEPGSSIVRASADIVFDEPHSETAVITDFADALKSFRIGECPPGVSNRSKRNYDQLARALHEVDDERPSTLDIKGLHTQPMILDITPLIREANSVGFQAIPSIGSFDGEVRGIHGVREQYLDLYEDFTNRRVKVLFTEIEDDIIRSAFRRRIRASGLITFSPSGTPILEAKYITVFDYDKSRPLLTDLAEVMEG